MSRTNEQEQNLKVTSKTTWHPSGLFKDRFLALGYDPVNWYAEEIRTLPADLVQKLQDDGGQITMARPGQGFERNYVHNAKPGHVETPDEKVRRLRQEYSQEKFVRVQFLGKMHLGDLVSEFKALGYPCNVEIYETRSVPESLLIRLKRIEKVEKHLDPEIERLQQHFFVLDHKDWRNRLINQTVGLRDNENYLAIMAEIDTLDQVRSDAIAKRDWKKSAKLEEQTRKVWLSIQ